MNNKKINESRIHIHIRSILIFSIQLIDTLEIQIVPLSTFIDILKPNFQQQKFRTITIFATILM